MVDKESTTEKGEKYEKYAKKMLTLIKNHFGIEHWDERKPGHQKIKGKKSGAEHKIDLIAYKPDGKMILFSCKNWKNERPRKESIADLFLIKVDTEVDDVYLVSNQELSANPKLCAEEYLSGSITLKADQSEDVWQIEIAENIKSIFHGFTESISIHEEWKIVLTKEDGSEEVHEG